MKKLNELNIPAKTKFDLSDPDQKKEVDEFLALSQELAKILESLATNFETGTHNSLVKNG